MKEKKKELSPIQQNINKIGWDIRDTLEDFKKATGKKQIEYAMIIVEREPGSTTTKIGFCCTDGSGPKNNIDLLCKFIRLIVANRLRPVTKPKPPLDTVIH